MASTYEPFVEPLAAEQQRQYQQAGARGADAPLQPPQVPLTITVPSAVASTLTALDDSVTDRLGAVTALERPVDQKLDMPLPHFGYDLFNVVPSTFAPVDSIPVPADYKIGPGDTLVIQLFGNRNVEFTLVVTRDGQILIPEYGPLAVSGLTFDEAERLIVEGFEQRVIGAKAVVSIGKLRTIQVRVTGDVNQPGIYTVGALTTLIDALIVTGGVKTTGSLRRIRLYRGDVMVSQLDLYDLLLRGHTRGDATLRHGDTIFVPALGPVAYVAGEVQRPAIYELLGKVQLDSLIDMAGGLLPGASLTSSHIERISVGAGKTIIDLGSIGKRSLEDITVVNGDLLRVLPKEDRLDNVVFLEGHVRRPGGYQFLEQMRLSELISGPEELLHGADIGFAAIRRENPTTLRTEIIYFKPEELFGNRGGAPDIALVNRDVVMFFRAAEAREKVLAGLVKELREQAGHGRPPHTIVVSGSTKHTGTFPLQAGARLLDVVALAGGVRSDTDRAYVVVSSMDEGDDQLSMRAVDLEAATRFPEHDDNLLIRPRDKIYFFGVNSDRSALMEDDLYTLREQARYGAEVLTVGVLGEVSAPGTYPLEPGMRTSDLVCAAGGLTRKAAGLNASLSRHSKDGQSQKLVEHIQIDIVALLSLCEYRLAVKRGDALSEAQHLYMSRLAEMADDYVLQPMDQLAVSVKANWVEKSVVYLSGEVINPGSYVIDPGETLCEVLQRAGGITNRAYLLGAVFTRQSALEMQQKTIEQIQGQLDELMVELSLSHSARNAEKNAENVGDKRDYLNVINQLERAKPTGRVVIDLEEQLRCRRKSQMALQDGDRLEVPIRPDFVMVSGQVYVPTSQQYTKERTVADYVKLSGGHTVLGRLNDTFVIQPNGEVLNYSGRRRSSSIAHRHVMPGARIFVPLNVDRMNATEKAQSWVSSLTQAALLAGLVL